MRYAYSDYSGCSMALMKQREFISKSGTENDDTPFSAQITGECGSLHDSKATAYDKK